NLIAGKKAKAATAYQAAYEYFNEGLKLLNDRSWQEDYNLSLSLHEYGAEAAFLSGDFPEMEALTEIVLKRATNILEKVKIYDIKIQGALSLGQPKEAIKIGLTVINKLGIRLGKKPTELEIKKAFEETASLYAGREIESLINLPEMTAAKPIAASYIFSSIAASAYIADPELLILMVLSFVNLSLERGHSPWGAFTYNAYALMLCMVLEDIESGYKFGKLALSLARRSNAKDTCKALHVFGAHILHRKKHIKKTVPILIEAYQVGRETGDLEYATYAAFMACFHLYYLGDYLEKLEEKVANYSQAIAECRREVPLGWMGVLWQTVLNLQGKSENPLLLIGDGYNEERSLPLIIAANDRQQIHLVYASKLILCYLLESYEMARENAVLAGEYIDGPQSMVAVPVFYTYDSLAHLRLAPQPSDSQKQLLLERVNINQEKLKKWAIHAPMNYQHKFNLVEAEKARFLGEAVKAMDLYEKAIKGARKNQFIQEEALAYELAAKFYLGRGMEEIAQTYLTKARYCYLRWGATLKVKDLEAKYLHLIEFDRKRERQIYADMTNTSSSSDGSYNAALDLAAIMKATTAISSEIVLDKLLVSLMKIILDTAGAQKGYLILESGGKLLIEAEAIAHPETIKVLQSVPIEKSDLVCESIVNYVFRTKETVVLNHGAEEGKFTNDPYIKKHQPKSIVCHPPIPRGTTVSIVYLENNLATGAFTSERVEVLKTLSSPAAISIENARLYANLAEYNRTLETKVEKRTAELAIAKQKAEVAAQAKGAFLANMSHELRSPLNAILGFAELTIESPNLPEKYKKHARIIHNSGEHLLAVINEVLDMAKIESGRATRGETEFSLLALLDDLRGLFELKAAEKGLQFIVNSSADLPRRVVGDEVKLRQISINLLSNAFKFTSRGKVTLAVGATPAAENETVTLVFEVRDTGSGITAEELETIFEPFVQTKSGGQVAGGTGLGLSISRDFVRLMGGEMTVESEAGKGSVFKFEIKCQRPAGLAPGGATQPADVGLPSSTEARAIDGVSLAAKQGISRILVVDDRPENRLLLFNILQPLGFEVKEASNGREAIQVWESWQPHLIFMDLQMPIMDGFQGIREIRSREKKWTSFEGPEVERTGAGPTVKIVVVTASSSEANRQEALEAGCDDFLVKPFKNADIIETIDKTIGVRYIDPSEEEVSEEEVAPEGVYLLTPAAIAALSPELVEALEAAIIRLNVKAMEECVEQIRPHNSALSVALEALINDFNYAPILDAIKEVNHKAK
ncbi:MAG: ATP-binding protein, partial [Cyanobacteriota bacterium]|nr:ATP-binding protein [Cyanobacteriota bacterium]